MNDKQRAQKRRGHIAASLSHIAMRLQRAPADQQAKLLKAADRCLHNYKMARILENTKPSGTIEDHISDEATMQSLAEVIGENVKPHGFALLVFTTEEGDDRCNYVSNSHRDDICAAMAEFIAAHEERLLPGPDTKQ